MDLPRAHVFKVEPIRRSIEEAAELRNRMKVGSLRRRRKIADRHVLDHAATQRAQFGHRGPPVCRGGRGKPTFSDRSLRRPLRLQYRASGFVQSPAIPLDREPL
ncbi:protein of unknown function [Magnetospirillum sp. XM-1]|nr:protein of unknown function [Magnetospirillum sp. XM-1]CUW37747.1 protein of unknown function [Magnetospirillum sp. XM-1]CUW40781.1 protein of unknown function [Magnetospirillum sp. XM-1]